MGHLTDSMFLSKSVIKAFTNKGLWTMLRKTSIEGVVTPIAWDDNYNIIAISISTPDEKEYTVKKGTLSDELLELVHRYVNVTGFLDEDEYGEKTISVENYELIEDGES